MNLELLHEPERDNIWEDWSLWVQSWCPMSSQDIYYLTNYQELANQRIKK